MVDQLALQLLALGDVLEGADQPHGPAVGRLDRAHRAHPDLAAIGRPEGQLQVPGLAAGHGALNRRLDRRAGLGCIKLDGASQRRPVVARHAVDTARLGRPGDLAAGDVELPAANAGQAAGAVEKIFALAQRLLLLLEGRDVLHRAKHPLGLAVGGPAHHPAARQQPHPVAVAVAQPGLKLVVGAAAGKVLCQALLDRRHVVRVQAVGAGLDRECAQVGQRIAQHRRPALIAAQGTAGQMPLPGASARALKEVVQALPLLLQCLLGAAAQGHVLHPGQDAQQLAVGAALDRGRQQHIDHRAAARDHLEIKLTMPALRQQGGHADLGRKFARVRGEELPDAAPQHLVPGITQLGQPGIADHRQPACRVDGVQHRRCAFIQAAQTVFAVGDGPRAVLQCQRGLR